MSRFDYVKFDARSIKDQEYLKEAFQAVERVIDHFPPDRNKALAFTKLEESYMWCGKALRDAQLARDAGMGSTTQLDMLDRNLSRASDKLTRE